MLTRILGKSGLEVSALGMGCWAIGGPWTWTQPGHDPFPAGWGVIDDQESIRAIQTSLDLGINFFDTAANYGAGHSEIVLGKALTGHRTNVVIATKFGHMVNEAEKAVYADNDQILKNVRQDVENSLRRLDSDYIDIYQLHEAQYEPERTLELRGVLEELVSEGKIRWYGWSTDLVDRARLFADGEHCTAIQFQLNALFDNPEMRQLCADFNMAGINKDPLHRGILTGKFTFKTNFPDDDIRSRINFEDARLAWRLKAVDALRDVFTSSGRTMPQGALAYIWALDERMVPIPGFKTIQQVKDNAGAMAYGPLTSAEMNQIDQIVAEFRPPETE
ncbi:MAG: aldo/keto reductase [Anaerolineales bacterium]|nr:aldo/keto reductase [Chloroflexota bacterium]MBL6980098.1 aldo/keto reductase [Anaerolineales bacterium]